jgi:MbtH protein
MIPDAERSYRVVVNDDHQHALWPSDQAEPPGWTWTGIEGTKSECLVYMDAVWTSMQVAPSRTTLVGHAVGREQ